MSVCAQESQEELLERSWRVRREAGGAVQGEAWVWCGHWSRGELGVSEGQEARAAQDTGKREESGRLSSQGPVSWRDLGQEVP